MCGFPWVVAVASIFAGVQAHLRSQSDLQVHESRTVVPPGYSLASPASPETVLQLRVALAQNNIDGLIDALYDVSNPDSPNYGQYLTKDQVSTPVLVIITVHTANQRRE